MSTAGPPPGAPRAGSPSRLALGLLLAGAAVVATAGSLPQEVASTIPDAQLGGSSRLTYLGFQVYDASLWVAPSFSVADFAQHPFALELTYLREFTGAAIAQRSVAEIRRQGPVDEERLAAWKQRMQEVFPNVRRGDRLTGVHQPGTGAVFLLNGRPLATIADEEFARRFFGIWLSPQTSDTRLRKALISQLATR